MQIQVYSPQKDALVTAGHVTGQLFSKLVRQDQIMHKGHRIGIQEEAIDKLKEMGVTEIVITEDDGVESFQHWATLDMWLKLGVLEDNGDGLQRFLAIGSMKKRREDLVTQKGLF